MKKIIFIVFIVTILFLLSWFVPLIPYDEGPIPCSIPPCPSGKGVETLKQFIEKINNIKGQKEFRDKNISEKEKYLGYYENPLNPKTNLELLFIDGVYNTAYINVPNFIKPKDENNNDNVNWGLGGFNDNGANTIHVGFVSQFKNGQREEAPFVLFKIVESYKKIIVEQSSFPDQIPIGLVLIKK